MKTRNILICAMLFAVVPAALAAAAGAGGVGFGYQYYDPQLSSANLNLAYITGYGYGTDWEGNRIGGFGTSFISSTGDGAGGVGGVIIGHEWRGGPLIAALTLWTGVGGAGISDRGCMLVFGEADFELGIRVIPWMEIVAYAGYQAWGNLIPGPAFSIVSIYTPVFGVRIGWGGMYY